MAKRLSGVANESFTPLRQSPAMTTIATRVDTRAYRLPLWSWPAAIPAIGALVALIHALLSRGILDDPDTWWHVVTGNLILDSGAVPTRDPFSFTFTGAPWTVHEWMSDVLFALAFRAAGWSGVVALTALAFGGTALILGQRLARDLSGIALSSVMALGVTLVMPTLLARPHTLATPFFVAWIAGLLHARATDRAPSWLLLPVMTIWANLHGSFTFGLAMIGPVALEALLASPATRRREVVAGWAVFGVSSLAAAVVSPHGVHGLVFPFQLMSMKSLAVIGEWQPVNFSAIGPLEVALLGFMATALRLGLRMPLLRALLLLALVHMALSHARHQLVLGLVGPLLIAGPLRDALALASAESPVGRTPWHHRAAAQVRTWAPLAAAVAACLALGIRLAIPVARVNGSTAPLDAIAAVPASLRSQPVLNSYGFGGYLIFSGIRTFIDGRADMYSDAFIDTYLKVAKPDPKVLDETLSRDRIQWTIFAPEDLIVQFMDIRPGWHRFYADDHAVIHVRDESDPSR